MKAVARLGLAAALVMAAAAPAAASVALEFLGAPGSGSGLVPASAGAVPVPSLFDPGTIILLGTGLMGLLAYTQRRKSTKK